MNREVRVLLLASLVLVLAGFRGDTARESRGNFINEIRVTANGVYRFAKDTQGHTATASLARSVTYLDVFNGTSTEATLTLFGPACPGTADSLLVYVPAMSPRSYPGLQIDSVRVAATYAGAAVLLGGMD